MSWHSSWACLLHPLPNFPVKPWTLIFGQFILGVAFLKTEIWVYIYFHFPFFFLVCVCARGVFKARVLCLTAEFPFSKELKEKMTLGKFLSLFLLYGAHMALTTFQMVFLLSLSSGQKSQRQRAHPNGMTMALGVILWDSLKINTHWSLHYCLLLCFANSEKSFNDP